MDVARYAGLRAIPEGQSDRCFVRVEFDMTYPSDPCAAISTKSDTPCWLKGLKVFVWLEERLDAQCVDIAEREKEPEDDEPRRASTRRAHLLGGDFDKIVTN